MLRLPSRQESPDQLKYLRGSQIAFASKESTWGWQKFSANEGTAPPPNRYLTWLVNRIFHVINHHHPLQGCRQKITVEIHGVQICEVTGQHERLRIFRVVCERFRYPLAVWEDGGSFDDAGYGQQGRVLVLQETWKVSGFEIEELDRGVLSDERDTQWPFLAIQ